MLQSGTNCLSLSFLHVLSPCLRRHENVSSLPTASPFVIRLEYYKSRIFSNKRDKCTMVMLTYRRLASLPTVVTTYCNIASLDKFLIIWNDVENVIPTSVLDLSKKCSVELKFITPKVNKLSNRFWQRPEIETECKKHFTFCWSSPTNLFIFRCLYYG